MASALKLTNEIRRQLLANRGIRETRRSAVLFLIIDRELNMFITELNTLYYVNFYHTQ